ncbi:MAG: GntR family transcriptional regulator [Lautropia sp.]
MAKQRTANLPDLSSLIDPLDAFTLDIQRVLLRRGSVATPSLSTGEQIAARLAGMIALDRIEPGQRLLEEEICKVLAVSRAPVREAMRILERDRLLVIAPRRGARVSGHDARELRDMFEVRASLLATLVAAVMRERAAELEALLAAGTVALDAARRVGSRDGYALVSFQLMMRLCWLSSNVLLAEMVQSLALQTLRYARLGFGQPEAVSRSLRDWRRMLRAVRDGDVESAAALAATRVRGSCEAALATLGHTSAGGGSATATPRRRRRAASTSPVSPAAGSCRTAGAGRAPRAHHREGSTIR